MVHKHLLWNYMYILQQFTGPDLGAIPQHNSSNLHVHVRKRSNRLFLYHSDCDTCTVYIQLNKFWGIPKGGFTCPLHHVVNTPLIFYVQISRLFQISWSSPFNLQFALSQSMSVRYMFEWIWCSSGGVRFHI